MSNLARRLELQGLLATPAREWTVRELATRLGVSKLTVARDLEALSCAGVPVVAEAQGQTLRWRMLQRPAGGSLQPPPPVSASAPTMRYPRARWPVKPHVLRALEEAMAGHRLVRVRYQARGARQVRELSLAPLRLEDVGGVLYLRALAEGRGEGRRRTLVGWRIRAVEVLDACFTSPPRPRKRGFGAVDERTHEVAVWFDPVIAPFIEERRWHPAEKLTRHADGALTWRARVSGMHEVVGWVMSWGARAEVLRPVEWRDEARRRALGMAERYEPREQTLSGASKERRLDVQAFAPYRLGPSPPKERS